MGKRKDDGCSRIRLARLHQITYYCHKLFAKHLLFYSFRRSPEITITSFDRPNLYLEVKNKVKGIVENFLPFLHKESHGKYATDGSTIVYCPTKKSTEEVFQALSGQCVCFIFIFIFKIEIN